jgi:Rrf2 family cysteine metabolism transcriptional repressor
MIRLSTRIRYGLRAMIDLASYEQKEPVYLNEIASNQRISRNYLDSLFSSLRSSGLVRSLRGSHGGYCLTREPADIKVLDIIDALQGKPVLIDCLENQDLCDRAGTCAARELWKKVRTVLESTLSDVTLKDLVDLVREKKEERALMYYI